MRGTHLAARAGQAGRQPLWRQTFSPSHGYARQEEFPLGPWAMAQRCASPPRFRASWHQRCGATLPNLSAMACVWVRSRVIAFGSPLSPACVNTAVSMDPPAPTMQMAIDLPGAACGLQVSGRAPAKGARLTVSARSIALEVQVQ